MRIEALNERGVEVRVWKEGMEPQTRILEDADFRNFMVEGEESLFFEIRLADPR